MKIKINIELPETDFEATDREIKKFVRKLKYRSQRNMYYSYDIKTEKKQKKINSLKSES